MVVTSRHTINNVSIIICIYRKKTTYTYLHEDISLDLYNNNILNTTYAKTMYTLNIYKLYIYLGLMYIYILSLCIKINSRIFYAHFFSTIFC